MKGPKWQWLLLLVLLSVLWASLEHPLTMQAQGPECPAGFEWQRMSGVGCVQTNCLEIGNAKYTYTGACSCIDGYKGCFEPVDNSGVACSPFCPGAKLIACVAPEATCPGEQPPADAGPVEEPVDPASDESDFSTTVSEFVRDLERFLAGEGAEGPSPGRAAAGAIGTSILLGTWVLVNLLSGTSLDTLLAAVQGWGSKAGTPQPTATSGAMPSQVSELESIYSSGPGTFRQCQDMVYAKLWKQPPPHGRGQKKGEIFSKMNEEGYWEADLGGMYDPQGVQDKLKSLQDGDIIMFDAQGMPNVQRAGHYAVVENGKIYEILNLPKGGELNVTDVQNAYNFFKPRNYTSKVDGKTYSPAPYHGFRIFRKSGN